jgi:hypothetical protein
VTNEVQVLYVQFRIQGRHGAAQLGLPKGSTVVESGPDWCIVQSEQAAVQQWGEVYLLIRGDFIWVSRNVLATLGLLNHQVVADLHTSVLCNRIVFKVDDLLLQRLHSFGTQPPVSGGLSRAQLRNATFIEALERMVKLRPGNDS